MAVTYWNYNNFQEWKKNGCERSLCMNITYLDIMLNDLKEIPNEIKYLTKLRTLNCSCNKLKKLPMSMQYLLQLEELYCTSNKIRDISVICRLKKLKTIEFSSNIIKNIPKKINNLINLQNVEFSFNKITEIPKEINSLKQLQRFSFDFNNIKKIPQEIGNLFQLRECWCSNNKIKIIPQEIGNLIQLRKFVCNNNKITSIPIEIINCEHLDFFNFKNNEIDYIQPQITRWLNRLKNMQYLYGDSQSVHNHAIQEGVSKSINYITSIKPIIQNTQLKELIIENPYLEERVKCLLFEYIDNKEVHTILNITFEELLLSVYDFIEKNENKEELYKIMNVEMSEANCKCFTGRISRLINVLNGFDEHIEIHIADNEQIGNIISIIRNKLGENCEENEFKRRIREELTMRSYSEETINEWIDNI